MSSVWSFLTFVYLTTSLVGSSVVGRFGKTLPDISIVPSGYQFKEVGSKIVFTCIIGEHLAPGVAGNVHDWPLFKWKDPNQALILGHQNRIFSERVDAYKSKMYVTGVEEGDAGLYTCEVQTKDGLMLMASNNLFIYADINFVESSTKVEVQLGSSILLECQATGNPQPDVSWKFNGRKLPKDVRYEIQRNGLRIRKVGTEDGGVYECRAQVISQGNFKNLRISLDVLYAPIMNLPLFSPTVVQGKDAKLECQAAGNPPVTYRWIRGNSKTGMTLYKGHLGSYVLRNVTKDHEGEFTCVVENKFGVQEGTADLRVTVPPKVKVPEKMVSVLEGQELVLPCEADSSPLATFTWSRRQNDGRGRNETNLENWVVKTSEVGVSRLRMKNMTRNDAGNYTCRATNEAGYDYKDIQVAVDFLPKVTLKSPSEVYAWGGEQRVATCVVLGHPLPTVTWVKDKFTYLGSTPHHNINNLKEANDRLTSSLILKFDEELENSLYSNYSCTAKNQHGFDTKTVSIKRAYRPEMPRNLSVVNVTYDSFSLKTFEEVRPPNPAVPPVTHWVVKYKKSRTSPTTMAPKLKGTEYVLTRFQAGKPMRVEGLESNAEYLVLVSVGNVVGESGNVKFNVQTTKFHEDEPFQADQSLMSKSSLTRQEHLRLAKHVDERKRAKSFWDGFSIGLVVVVAGLLTVVTTVVLALAARNWRRAGPAKSGRYRIGSPSKDAKTGQLVRVADDRDVDAMTMKTGRVRTSVNDGSPFADLQTRYGSLPKKFGGDGARLVRPFDVVNNNVDHIDGQQQRQQQPMSSTLPRSRKMEVHVNRTASVMEMIEEKKTKQSQAWKEMLKLTTADLDEDSMVSRDDDDDEDGVGGGGDRNVDDDEEGTFEDGNHGNLPPPPSDMLPSPVKPPNNLMTSPQQQQHQQQIEQQQEQMRYSAPSNVNVNCKQGPFDAAGHVDDDDDISFIDDDDDEDDVIITHHSLANNGTNKKVHFEGKSFKQY